MVVTIPERLSYIRIVTTKDLSSKVVTELHRLGAIHIEKVGKVREEDIRKIRSELERVEEILKLVKEIEELIEKPELVLIKEEVPIYDVWGKLNSLRNKLENSLIKIRAIKRELEESIKRINELKLLSKVINSLITNYGLGNDLTDILYFKGELFTVLTLYGRGGNINEFIEAIKKSLSSSICYIRNFIINQEEGAVTVATYSRVTNEVLKLASKFSLITIKIPPKYLGRTLNEVSRLIGTDINEAEETTRYLRSDLINEVSKVREELALSKIVSQVLKERLLVLMNALSSEYLIGIEGWVPVRELPSIMTHLYNNLRYVLVTKVSTKVKPPTKLRNPRLVRLFEVITKIYGIPDYDEWDPTPIISVSLMIFFGLMFGDVIYGAVMFILVNYVLERTGLIDNPYSPGYVSFKKLLTCLSISSIIFGFLSNTYAGYSIVISNGTIQLTIVKHPIINVMTLLPITNPMFFIKLALIIGLIHVNIAHALALIKAIKSRDKGGILSKVGFFIAEAFGIPYVLHSFLNVGLGALTPFSNYLLYASIVGIALLIAGKFMEFRMLGAMFWLFDITGLLGDVMSYTRLAGIGLATTLLAQNFNSLALGAASGISNMVPIHVLGLVAGVIMAIIVIVFANLLNIVFGILGAFIHSLRLCFVEFLPKFYEGNGREFKAFTLEIPKAIIIGRGR